MIFRIFRVPGGFKGVFKVPDCRAILSNIRATKLLTKAVFLALFLVSSIINTPDARAGTLPTVERQPGVVCQLAAGMLYNEAYQAVSKIGLGKLLFDMLNPVKRAKFLSKKKSNAQKAILRMALVYTVVAALTATCPPIVIAKPFKGRSRSFRIDRARAEGFSPQNPDVQLNVESPADSASCTRTLNHSVDMSTGKITNPGDLPDLEFVYSEPFGSYPAVHSLLSEVTKEFADTIRRQMLSWLPSDILPNFPFDNLTDFIDGFTNIPFDYDIKLSDVPYLLDILNLLLDSVEIDLEAQANSKFNGWVSEIIDNNEVSIDAPAGTVTFHEGPSQWYIRAENKASPLPRDALFGYTQHVFVNEFFKPFFDVLYEIEDPNNPGTMLKIVADGEYEALEPGRADRSYTPPTSFQGSLGAHDNCDPDPKEFLHIPIELSLGIHYFPITAIDRAGNESETFYVRINVVDSIPPDVNPPESIGIEVAAGITQVNFVDPGIGCTTFLCQNSPNR